MDAKMTDNVNSPSHYARYRFECEPKDLTKFLPHPLASAIEYIIRAPFKGSELEDLKKARFWLEEFSNTQRFWNGTFRGADGQTTDTVCWITDKFEPELTATAIAILGQCQVLHDALLMDGYSVGEFPKIIRKRQVFDLVQRIDYRITSLESEQPSE